MMTIQEFTDKLRERKYPAEKVNISAIPSYSGGPCYFIHVTYKVDEDYRQFAYRIPMTDASHINGDLANHIGDVIHGKVQRLQEAESL